ncbi:MAG TPA: periplasmic heavy metal sensor [Candidatus Binatia bacterium]|jgi:Spy/CpxP family protein refolding chaperone|nr:periplasmic heavy metal sensor [Candidatus Binatia bacterium]
MDRLRAALWGSLVFLFLTISIGSSLAEDRVAGVGRAPFARGESGHRGIGSEAPWISIMLRHRTDLNLTAEQVATLEKMRSDFQQRVDPKQEELKNTEAEIARLLRENAVDLVRVKAKIEDAERLRAEFRYLRIEALESGKSVLTSEQRDKLENLASSGRGRFRRPHGEAS